jgi:hypothetical protein
MVKDDDGGVKWLDTVEGEIAFFRSLMRARPVGIHRHFHALAVRTAIHSYTGRYVAIDAIWAKLRALYNIDALETVSCLCVCAARGPERARTLGLRRLRHSRVGRLTARRAIAYAFRESLWPPFLPQGV